MDPHHKHIITGDLKMVKNKKLRELLSRGPNFREKNSINVNIAKKEIDRGIQEYIHWEEGCMPGDLWNGAENQLLNT